MDQDLDVTDLWREAFHATRGELTELGVKDVDLEELEYTGDEVEEFQAAARGHDLGCLMGSRSTPLADDAKHSKALKDLLRIIYQHAEAFDHSIHSPLIINLTWVVCRHLLQSSFDLPPLADRIKDLVQQVFSFADLWQNELHTSTYTPDLKAKRAILALFASTITFSALAKNHARQRLCQDRRWWNLKKHWKAFTSTAPDPEPSLQKLYCSVKCVATALENSAAPAQPCGHDGVQHRQSSLPKQSRKSGHRYSDQQLFDDSRAHFGDTIDKSIKLNIKNMQISIGEPSHLSSWLRIESIPERQPLVLAPGTCTWLLQTSKYYSWRRRDTSVPLILNGLPGSGKTSLAQFACDHLSNTSSRPVLSYFFDAALSLTSCKAQTFLVSILAQLYRGRPGPPQRAVSTILEHYRPFYQTVWDCPYQTLLGIVKQVLHNVRSYYLIVDSLDENIDESLEEKRLLRDFLMELGSKEGVSVMITCRTDAYSVLLGHKQLDHKTLRLQSYTKRLQADLTCFGEHETNTNIQLKELPWELKREIIKTLASSATFLQAELLIKLLSEQTTPGEIRDTMNKFGGDFTEELYEKLLSTSERRLSNSPARLARQKYTLQMLVAARDTLSLDQIAGFLAMNQDTATFCENDLILNIAQEVEKLCGSFVSISDSNRVKFFHVTAKTFFKYHPSTTADTSDLYLAFKCLAVLSQESYASIEKATQLLRRHYPISPRDGDLKDSVDLSPSSSIYRYAALYFHHHVTAVVNPPRELLAKVNQFLQGIEFVTWSETVLDFKPGTGYAAQIEVRASLYDWVQKLPPTDRVGIKIDQYFEAPFVRVSEKLSDTAEDKILQFLPRIRFGDFLNEAGQSTNDWQKAYIQKKIVYDGLSMYMPSNEPFLLMARASLLQEYFWQKRFQEVLPELLDLYRLQKEVIEQPDDGTFITAWLIGGVWIALGDYKQAEKVLSDTLEQVRQSKGIKDRFFNMLLLLEGQRLERVKGLDKAKANYEAALSTMTEIAGEQNIFVLMLKTSIGVILRKQGEYKAAKTMLFEGWAGRRKVSSINVNVCFDEAMQLATLYRDEGDAGECRELLDAIKDSSVRQDDFERNCQFIHISSLAAFDAGEYDDPKYTLMELIDSASGKDRARNNRELLWIRIDLADAMRLHDESDEALMLFSELVVASTPTETTEIYEELESPVQLAIAEKALRLVRDAEYAESERLLQENNLRWLREADFYFSIQGGPTLDTSIIHPIRVSAPFVSEEGTEMRVELSRKTKEVNEFLYPVQA